MNFEEDGFLSDDSEDIRKTIKERFPETFRFCHELNIFAYKFRNSLKLDYDSVLHIVLICLLQRVLDSYQAIITLMQFGLESDSEVITRSSLEAMFKIRKLVADDKYIQKYVGSDQLRRKKLLNIAKAKPDSVLGQLFGGPKLDKALEQIDADIKEMELSKSSIETIAKEVGLDAWYDLNYRNLSVETHVDIRSLEKYLERNRNGEIEYFNFVPKSDRTEAILITQSAILLIALDSLEKIFQTGLEPQIDALFKRIQDFRED